MTRRPKNYPRRAWFHLSIRQRKIATWLINWGTPGITQPSPFHFQIEVSKWTIAK